MTFTDIFTTFIFAFILHFFNLYLKNSFIKITLINNQRLVALVNTCANCYSETV